MGGALRDAWLGRPVRELDLAVGHPRRSAGRLADLLRGTLVPLDAQRGIYRVALKPGRGLLHLDVAALAAGGIVPDLARRDFSVNALAVPLSTRLAPEIAPGGLLDPRGGLADLARRLIRTESGERLAEDPLRILRAFRLAGQLGMEIEEKTLRLLRLQRAGLRRCAPERIQNELVLLLAEPGASGWVRRMDACRVLTAVFPALEPSRRCALEYYGAGGVLTHSLDTVARADWLLSNLERPFPQESESLRENMMARARGFSRHRAVLLLAALLHDVSKPATARRLDGRLRFFGHDALGAKASAAILKSLRFPREDIATVSTVVAQHLRPGNLVAGGPITPRASYRFFRDLGDNAISLLLVAWSDHASYLPEPVLLRLVPALHAGSGDPRRVAPECRKTVAHLRAVAQLIKARFAPTNAPPGRLADGRDVMRLLHIPPGPRVGALLEMLREAQAVGQLKSRRDALAFLRNAAEQ